MGQSSHCCPAGRGFWPAGREQSSFQAACHSGFEAVEKWGKHFFYHDGFKHLGRNNVEFL